MCITYTQAKLEMQAKETELARDYARSRRLDEGIAQLLDRIVSWGQNRLFRPEGGAVGRFNSPGFYNS